METQEASVFEAKWRKCTSNSIVSRAGVLYACQVFPAAPLSRCSAVSWSLLWSCSARLHSKQTAAIAVISLDASSLVCAAEHTAPCRLCRWKTISSALTFVNEKQQVILDGLPILSDAPLSDLHHNNNKLQNQWPCSTLHPSLHPPSSIATLPLARLDTSLYFLLSCHFHLSLSLSLSLVIRVTWDYKISRAQPVRTNKTEQCCCVFVCNKSFH